MCMFVTDVNYSTVLRQIDTNERNDDFNFASHNLDSKTHFFLFRDGDVLTLGRDILTSGGYVLANRTF